MYCTTLCLFIKVKSYFVLLIPNPSLKRAIWKWRHVAVYSWHNTILETKICHGHYGQMWHPLTSTEIVESDIKISYDIRSDPSHQHKSQFLCTYVLVIYIYQAKNDVTTFPKPSFVDEKSIILRTTS